MLNVPKFQRVPHPEKFTDYTAEHGVGTLASRIESEWHALGYTAVICKAIPRPGSGGRTAFGVESNLVNGLPPISTV